MREAPVQDKRDFPKYGKPKHGVSQETKDYFARVTEDLRKEDEDTLISRREC